VAETPILRRIMLALGQRSDIRVFRNNVGNAYQGTPLTCKPGESLVLRAWRRIQYGLFPGSGDLIGWRSIVVTPEMVGKRVAVFVSIECKSETGREQGNQIVWRSRVCEAGGIAGVARSEEQALEIINEGVL